MSFGQDERIYVARFGAGRIPAHHLKEQRRDNIGARHAGSGMAGTCLRRHAQHEPPQPVGDALQRAHIRMPGEPRALGFQ